MGKAEEEWLSDDAELLAAEGCSDLRELAEKIDLRLDDPEVEVSSEGTGIVVAAFFGGDGGGSVLEYPFTRQDLWDLVDQIDECVMALQDPETEIAAERMGVRPWFVAEAAVEMWGRSLSAERDARFATWTKFRNSRARAARRAAITRRLRTDLRAHVLGLAN